MTGDLLFYKSKGRWYERLICFVTKGPYCHVAIMISDTLVIAARACKGVGYELVPVDPNRYTQVPLPECTSPTTGLAWANSCVGKRYSWLDIFYQALKFLFPRLSLIVGMRDHYDCSDFATRYLLHCGVILPDALDDTSTVTPNSLYLALRDPSEPHVQVYSTRHAGDI